MHSSGDPFLDELKFALKFVRKTGTEEAGQDSPVEATSRQVWYGLCMPWFYDGYIPDRWMSICSFRLQENMGLGKIKRGGFIGDLSSTISKLHESSTAGNQRFLSGI
jgi:hypothetical protein